jgi:hypothetical protein
MKADTAAAGAPFRTREAAVLVPSESGDAEATVRSVSDLRQE